MRMRLKPSRLKLIKQMFNMGDKMLMDHQEVLNILNELQKQILDLKIQVEQKFGSEMDDMDKNMNRKNLSDL